MRYRNYICSSGTNISSIDTIIFGTFTALVMVVITSGTTLIITVTGAEIIIGAGACNFE